MLLNLKFSYIFLIKAHARSFKHSLMHKSILRLAAVQADALGEAAEGRSGPDSSVYVYLRQQEATQQLLKVNIQWGVCEYGGCEWERDLKTDREREREMMMSQRIRGNEIGSDIHRGRESIITPTGVRRVEGPSSVSSVWWDIWMLTVVLVGWQCLNI